MFRSIDWRRSRSNCKSSTRPAKSGSPKHPITPLRWLTCGFGRAQGRFEMTTVAVLFARLDSVYKTLPDTDVWDIDRDARKWLGGAPIVAHPPCRAWGRLSHMAKPRHDEKDLARFAVRMVRKYGGVLEHPSMSALWQDQSLPLPGAGPDQFGGWTLGITQHWWGHRAEKATWLYIVGVAPRDIPEIPMRLGGSSHVIASSTARQHRGHPSFRPEVTKPERERTPPKLADWLLELARRTEPASAAHNSSVAAA